MPTATFDVEASAAISAAGSFVGNLARALEPVGERIHAEEFDQLRERWGEEPEVVAEFHRAEARSHERTAGYMRDLAKTLLEDAERYETLAKTEWQRARDCDEKS